MSAAGHVMEKERLLGRGGVQFLEVFNRLVGQVRGQIVSGLSLPRVNLGCVLEKKWSPLIGLASQETVEVFKAHSGGPLIEGSCLAVLITWRVMFLAEPR